MNEELVKTSEVIYRTQVKKLKVIEDELIKMIADTNNEALMAKFIDWQTIRLRANETYIQYLKELIDPVLILAVTGNSYDYRLIYERKTLLITQMYERNK